MLHRFGPALISYSDPAGLPRLREALAAMLSATRGVAVDPSSVLITRGSQMALALAARALTRPGDAIAVEHPGYRPHGRRSGSPVPRSSRCESMNAAWTSRRSNG